MHRKAAITSLSDMKLKVYEDELQAACMTYLNDLEHYTGKLAAFHVPNGGKRHIRAAQKFKKMGVRAGVPDIVILLSGGKIIFIELKVRGNTLQASQKKMHQILKFLGFSVHTVEAAMPAEAVAILSRILQEHGVEGLK